MEKKRGGSSGQITEIIMEISQMESDSDFPKHKETSIQKTLSETPAQ